MNPKLNLKISSAKKVTVDDVVREANVIWKEARSRKLKMDDFDGTEALLKEMQKKHPEFCESYPIVNRYICQMQEYDAKAFRLWLLKIQEHPWKTEIDYIEAQADYITKLFCARKPRANRTEINNIRINMRAILTDEHNRFKKCVTDKEKEVTNNEEYLKEKNADELFDFAKLLGEAGISKAETFRVECDTCAHEKIDVDALADKITHAGPAIDTADDLLS